jgi:Flp pilus assembly protein TadG
VTLRVLPSLGRSQNGATLVEFALVAPVFFALLFGTLEFGRALWTQQALQQTAIAGARCMALPQTNCATATYAYSSANTVTYIRGVASQWGISLPSANITQNNVATCGGANNFSQVEVTFAFESVVPYLTNIPTGGIPLSATACFPNNSSLK